MLFSHIVKIFEFIKAEVVIKALLEPHVKLAIFLVEFDKKLRKLVFVVDSSFFVKLVFKPIIKSI